MLRAELRRVRCEKLEAAQAATMREQAASAELHRLSDKLEAMTQMVLALGVGVASSKS